MAPQTSIKFLESWYEAQCNGTWEHGNGITVESLATAGWVVTIDVRETALEGHPMHEFAARHSDTDWIVCRVSHNQFHGEGDPGKLSAILRVFETWASQAPAVK